MKPIRCCPVQITFPEFVAGKHLKAEIPHVHADVQIKSQTYEFKLFKFQEALHKVQNLQQSGSHENN